MLSGKIIDVSNNVFQNICIQIDIVTIDIVRVGYVCSLYNC